MRLEKWQRNSVFDIIRAAGLDPKDFDLVDKGDNGAEYSFILKHKWSESCFIVSGNPSQYHLRIVVGDSLPWSIDKYSWTSLIERMRLWLDDVKRDIQTPDLWAELSRDAGMLGASSYGISNAPFTSDEQNNIAEHLQYMAEHVRQHYSLSIMQTEKLDALIDYAVKAAGRMGRTDWRNALVGVVLGWVISAAVAPEYAHEIFMHFLRPIAHLLGM